jgi:hypothetical protein
LSRTKDLEEAGHNMRIGLNWLRKGSLACFGDHSVERQISAKSGMRLFLDQNLIVFRIMNPRSLVENYQLFSHFLTSLETAIFPRMVLFRGVCKSEGTDTLIVWHWWTELDNGNVPVLS